MIATTRNYLYRSVVTLVTAVFVAACGGSSGLGLAGIGGSGFVASGSISGFGSVIVNGVKFDTSSATFDIDGAPGTQNDLSIGMRVFVDGVINNDGASGTATHIRYSMDLQGPVTMLSNIDPLINNGETRTFKALGVTVEVNLISTHFEISNAMNIPAGTTFDFYGTAEGLKNNNHVVVNGFFDEQGVLHADRIELRRIIFDAPTSTISIKGRISALNNTIFNLNIINNTSIKVDATASPVIEGLTNGLENGAFVEVKGVFDPVTNTITASKIKAENNVLNNNSKASIEGIVSGFNGLAKNFMVDGFTVDASGAGANLLPANITLRNGLRVEVEGPVINGVLQATTVRMRAGEAKVHASVLNSPLAGNDSFTVEPVSGQAITITTTQSTEYNNVPGKVLTAGDFLRIRGFENAAGGVTATRITKRTTNEDVIVEGAVTAGNANSTNITVLGITMNIDANTTQFKDINNGILTQQQFFDAGHALTGISRVKLRDRINNSGGASTPPDGIADDIELEN